MELRLEAGTAAVMLDHADRLSGPVDPDQVMVIMREARFLAAAIRQAFEDQGIDPDEVERPEIPRLRPGSKHQPSQEL